ncbi:unnamed protein product [Clonostachys byssicola]|uniref:Uncharacterized protein n=1 Tax=Clonostachys byssicola TaxID=160290 RepID=A0A9N9U4L0_9HYPO|nr:unnamed protein product [Clonostachys byssicola]
MSDENRPITPPIGRSVVNGETVPVFQRDNAFPKSDWDASRPMYMFCRDWYDLMNGVDPDEEDKNPSEEKNTSDEEKARAYFVIKKRWVRRRIWLAEWTRTLLPGMLWGHQLVEKN